ncbi:hypothetical protein C2S51_003713 [Perilla frutescens var. frutescens]|nr:hypothetical protein C2S51_003713 [Perilla frutescens var. frutescens]
MDIDRPHFRTPSTAATSNELFICFTSRLSSSSMKLSKSILSPGRAARDAGPVSLSSSLSRRLRTNGSLKGGQASPFFTTTGKKRGCAFENPEPSSPKVTCIGQVRVKTKKKVKQSRSLSKRRSGGGGGEVSFRKIEQTCGDGDDKVCGQQQQQRYSNASAHYQPPQECLPHRNQRWVHLPISICEALRTFGSEFSCLFPCRSSCSSTGEREKSEKQNGDENGCGAVFARWLVSVNDGEGGKRREIELVVGGGEEEEVEESVSMRTSRRHVFEDIEVKDDRIELKGQSLEREEEAARVSICIPPKNALLLMRCGSDPMKMAALANRFSWDAAAAKNENEDIIIEEEEVEEEKEGVVDGKDEVFEQEVAAFVETNEEKEAEYTLETEGDGEEIEEEGLEISIEEMLEEKTEELEIIDVEGGEEGGGEEEEVESNMSSFEALLEQENAEHYEDCCPIQDEEEVEEDTQLVCHLSPSTESEEEEEEEEEEEDVLQCNEESADAAMDKEAQGSSIELKDSVLPNEEENQETETTAVEDEEEEQPATEAKSEKNQQTEEFVEEKKIEKKAPLLPECLLLMMCEPKLSMEVSKETWVCSTDFMPERPRRAVKPAKPIIEKNELQQPPRSSCSLPAAAAAASMASMIEQKLVNAAAYEPFVLTRCKSEPMRTAAAKLMPESCFWKNAVRKLEPHTMGVGAAGVGF